MPKHKKVIMPDIEEMQLGPGKYEIKMNLVEKDLGKGVPSFQAVNKKNDRLGQILKDLIKEVPNGIIFPNYDFDKPERLVFKYHEPWF